MKKHANLLLVFLLIILVMLSACSNTISDSLPSENIITEANIVATVDAPTEDANQATEPVNTLSPQLPSESTFEIHFIDVGQADAALVLCDDEAMLIDGGNSEDSSLMYSYLKKHGVDHLDYTVATHAHEDHVGGVSGALNYATTDIAYCPVTEYDSKAFENFKKTLAKQGVEITVPSHGQSFELGSSFVEIIGHISPSPDEPNNSSIVLRITYGETSFLFTGDAEALEENEILDKGYDISCDVLKVGHHGSDTSTGYRWLREAAPSFAVISVGNGNSYGHPTENTLSKLRDADVTTFRTDMQGHIICTSDGSTVTFTVEKNPDADTLSGAGAGGNHTDTVVADPEYSQDTQDISTITFIVNINTGKFHNPGCSSVDQMAGRNKLEVTESRDELIADGYSPCGRCNP